MHDWPNKLFKNIFSPAPESIPGKIFHIVTLIVLFSIGFAFWCWFFNRGRLTFVPHDWSLFGKYLSVIKQSLADKAIPYYVSNHFLGTDRFLGLPETILSPQIFLLNYSSIGTFVLIHFLILYTLGFAGCILIKRKFELSLFTFSILFMIFNFNGHIISHLSVGHLSWGGYFLLPYFVLWSINLADGEDSKHQIGKLAFILFGILLQGSLHIYLWCLILLGTLCIQGKGLRKPIMMIILLSFSLSAFRLFPAAITFFNKEHGFVSGFPSIAVLVESLIQIRDPNYLIPMGSVIGVRVGWWEFSHYISVLGFGMIIYFGYYQRLKNYSGPDPYLFRHFDLPIIVLTVFSLSYIFGLIASLPIPLINVERNSSRFLILPLLLLTVISCVRLQQTLNNHKVALNTGLMALAGLLHGLFSLGTNALNWQLVNLQASFKDLQTDLTVSLVPLSQKSEWLYLLTVKFSFIISVLTLGACAVFFWPSKKTKAY
jgi:hypothetical protein